MAKDSSSNTPTNGVTPGKEGSRPSRSVPSRPSRSLPSPLVARSVPSPLVAKSKTLSKLSSTTGTESDSEASRSCSLTLPSTSLQYDPTWVQRIAEYVASAELRTTNSLDDDFNDNLRRCSEAMNAGIDPLRIPSGSSGSYFIRDLNQETIAVFKPKNEEPFAPLNPKWPKYFQRILCFCCFGRACLIPNNGYLSETGASLVDQKLKLNIVPKTRIVKLASPAFFYKRHCWKATEPQLKAGSYQLFVRGFVSATSIVPEWSRPGQACPLSLEEAARFKVLFQKMCVLDYIIRNTDRHMDNWLIKYEKGNKMELAAIDNGLAFPVKHPETASRLRPFPFGWAHLSWAKMPWDEKLRRDLLETLTPPFVEELCDDIKVLFKYDKESNRFLKYKQLRVLRGQSAKSMRLGENPKIRWLNRDPSWINSDKWLNWDNEIEPSVVESSDGTSGASAPGRDGEETSVASLAETSTETSFRGLEPVLSGEVGGYRKNRMLLKRIPPSDHLDSAGSHRVSAESGLNRI